jgi:glycosyltransferase involved in cell wall biosynthesis
MTRRRLAVYTDYAYTRRDGVVFAERAFALFMTAVLEHAEAGTIVGRLRPSGGQARYPLPATTRFVALPYYPDGSRVASIVKALVSSSRAMWRSLDSVDTVWVLGPHGLAVPFALLALARGRRLRLGVRQDLRRYARTRHPGRANVHRIADGLEYIYRLLARRYPLVVVGEGLARNYRGSRAVLTTSVSLIRAADIVDPQPPAAEPPTAHERLNILSVGRVDTEKNPLLLIDIVHALVRADSRWRLTVCGEGPLLPALAERVRQEGLADHVDLRGYVPFDELGGLYRSSDLFLHVSLTEGVPQVLFEAFAAGVPVVATDVGGVRAAVDNAAVLIAPDSAAQAVEAITALQRDPEARRDLVEVGSRIARHHTLEQEAARVAEFLLGDQRPGPEQFLARLPGRLQTPAGPVLDLRCGAGDTCLALAGRGDDEVLGVDTRDIAPARRRLDQADPAVRHRVRFEQVDAETWMPQARAYDLVVLRDDFTHTPARLLDWARTAVSPSGSVAVEFAPGAVTVEEFADAMARSRLHCTDYDGGRQHGPIVSVWARPLYEPPDVTPPPVRRSFKISS